MSIRIVTDSNCDLPQLVLEECGITVVPFYINIGSKSFLDVVEMSRAEFYEGLPDFEAQPMTSVPGPGTYVEVYEKLAADGATEILSIHMLASLSAMVTSARLAAEEWDKLPVTVFDSGNLTGHGPAGGDGRQHQRPHRQPSRLPPLRRRDHQRCPAWAKTAVSWCGTISTSGPMVDRRARC